MLVIHAGNDKDDPLEIPALLAPLEQGTADFVQGSRYLGGGGFGNMPRYRGVRDAGGTPAGILMAARKRVTESTNGFAARFRTAILRDPRIDWRQDVARSLRARAVPDAESDPARIPARGSGGDQDLSAAHAGYTKMRPVIDWWSIIRPVVYLGLGLKK